MIFFSISITVLTVNSLSSELACVRLIHVVVKSLGSKLVCVKIVLQNIGVSSLNHMSSRMIVRNLTHY